MNNVISLLALEFAKFRKSSVIGLLTILYVIMMPTVIFVGKEFKNVPPPLPNNTIFFNFPTVWDYLGYAGNWLVFFFLGLISVFIVVNEVSYKTFRQNVITGLTRRKYFLAKVYSIVALVCLQLYTMQSSDSSLVLFMLRNLALLMPLMIRVGRFQDFFS